MLNSLPMSKYTTQDVKTPNNGDKVRLNYYWLCKDGDLGQAIFFETMPQANLHRQICERLKDYTAERTGWEVEIVFAHIAYLSSVTTKP